MEKHIYCPPPDRQCRLEILRVLSKDMHVDSEVDFEQWSNKLIGFTGADIQEFLGSAELKAIREIIDTREDDNNSAPKEPAKTNGPSKQSDLMIRYPASINQVQKHQVAQRATLA
jgi:transitional endoplasmic reticulum ATPase